MFEKMPSFLCAVPDLKQLAAPKNSPRKIQPHIFSVRKKEQGNMQRNIEVVSALFLLGTKKVVLVLFSFYGHPTGVQISNTANDKGGQSC